MSATTTTDRALLGAADLPDSDLAALAARRVGWEPAGARLAAAEVAVWPYDLEALTTGGRYRVTVRVQRDGGQRDGEEAEARFFVKVVQSWSRNAAFASVPPQVREHALAGLPWWVEPAVYRSGIAERLPQGLTMPRALAVVDLDEESAALWLEAVDAEDVPWTSDRFAEAARLLGRLAASPSARDVADAVRGPGHRIVRQYAEGRVAHQLVPALDDEGLWHHPLLAQAFDADLRRRLRQAAAAVGAVVDELEALPVAALHGDACPRNLLVRPGRPGFVLIDPAFWSNGPVGFDLGQLLLGEVQLGERPASELPHLEEVCLPAYVAGLHEEGLPVGVDVVRRGHALQMLLFVALSAVPFEHLDGPPTAERHRVAGERAAAARWVLDLVAATA